MKSEVFTSITANLCNTDVDTSVEAAGRLNKEAEIEDVPKLLELLQSDDFFVREAAAWPLAELAGVKLLPELFVAYQRGFGEGHDNDGFTAALLEIPAIYPNEARQAIEQIVATAEEPIRSHASWLLEFCTV